VAVSDKQRFNRLYVLPVAQKLAAAFRPFCDRLEIAGSLRRGKIEVADIELVYVSKPMNPLHEMFGSTNPQHIDGLIERMLRDGTLEKRPSKTGAFTWGPQNKLAVHVPSGIPVDLFTTCEENWITSLVVRTGGKASNLELTTACKSTGRRLLAYGAGVLNLATGEIARPTSEEDLFRICGAQYRRPEDRA
jgi:DNA polymerase/3'-5' exonuclease PolX